MQTKLQKVYFQCDFVCIWAALSECNYEGMRSRQMFEVTTKNAHMQVLSALFSKKIDEAILCPTWYIREEAVCRC